MSRKKKFRKKPVVIEAEQWFYHGQLPEVRVYPDNNDNRICNHCGLSLKRHGLIQTLEGGHIVCPGDWVITGIKGERYPCKPNIFDETYELAEDEGN